ncbi:hypothetical protein C5B42_03050 [Candidatus Cerribacteria bacterium 'Amazon FNV 2010 28 9']|uniref:Uncharacterized protein n=1 Tax=Candidatus Cerribacteria bacterium 'Amazon FNV 2010 28 9' TaxID=2081795 RepID=A0A317JP61_9BACT|nr:MAG: hypothetical protein C5B42_03050 [Candidatus Cerribacteria bacterium 'Amazon FNV 2010 28 9']
MTKKTIFLTIENFVKVDLKDKTNMSVGTVETTDLIRQGKLILLAAKFKLQCEVLDNVITATGDPGRVQAWLNKAAKG